MIPTSNKSIHVTNQVTCSRCHQQFDLNHNDIENYCQFHPDLFIRRPHPSHHYVYEIETGTEYSEKLKNWTCQFWDCCGQEDPKAPGCTIGKHIPYT